ncbi:MAG: YcxB family protein [Clostridiales bacterium]|nr:YcxB family protein [Clostridiales bacterium]
MDQTTPASTAGPDMKTAHSENPPHSTHPQGPALLDVRMEAAFIFDMLLYHMYSTLGGFLMNMVGLAVIMIGGMQYYFGNMTLQMGLGYCAFGILLLLITPVNLWLRAKNTMKLAKYQDVILYRFDDDGIDEVMSDGTNHYGWNQVEKAISTPKTISYYMEGNDSVLIFPKVSFTNEGFRDAMWYLSHHVVMGKIYIH